METGQEKQLKDGSFLHEPNLCVKPDPDNMKSVEREKFLNWRADKIGKKYLFDFTKEIVEYCTGYGEILTEACLEFRQYLLDTSSVFCYTERTTIA